MSLFHSLLAMGTSKTIVSVENTDDLIVEYSTPFDDVKMLLPSYRDFTLSDASVVSYRVDWAIGPYAPGTAGVYAVEASPDAYLPGNITNPSNVVAESNITVLQRYSIWFSVEYLTSLFQESATNDVTNPVTADGNPVGTIYDRGNDALYARTLTNTNRPILGSDAGTMEGYVTGQSVNLLIPSSTNRYRYFYDTNTWFYQICFRMEAGSDGLLKQFMRSLGATPNTGDVGISVRRSTGNKFQFFSYKGTAGNVVCSITSAQNITVASGWVWAQVVINGSGANTATLYLTTESGADVVETFSTNAGSVTAGNSTTDMQFGGDTLTSISAIFSDQRIPSAGEITAFKTYNPSRKTDNFPLVKKWDLFDDPAFLFSDSGGTTPSTNGGIVRFAQSKKPIFLTNVTRTATATTDAKSPIFDSADTEINNYPSVEWDGTDDNLDLSSQWLIERARYIMVLVAKNEDATDGSHLLSGERYIALTGSAYTSGSNPRLVTHVIDTSTSFSVAAGNLADVYQVFVLQQVGAAWTVWNGNKLKSTGTNNLELRLNDIGDHYPSIGALWTLDGKFHRAIQFNGTLLNDEQAENIIDYFKLKLQI